jgi:tRNA modification GTPase
MSESRSTIAALSSGAVPSGIAVIRLSGPKTREALERLAGAIPKPRRLVLKEIRNQKGETLDKAFVAFFPSPHSYTGEDCAELHLHGSRAVVAAVLNELEKIEGIGLAEAGAFTRRAFEAGKLDLTRVEGLADLIEAETEAQRQQAIRRSSGELADKIKTWRQSLTDLRAEIEARLDFSDEGDVAEALPAAFHEGLKALEKDIGTVLAGYEGGRIVRDGFKVVIAGAPNTGKSSLLNALAGSEEAIVSPEEGTTRDVKEVRLDLDGQYIRLFDVAGLRQSASIAEKEGVKRAERAMKEADLVLWLIAPDVKNEKEPNKAIRLWRVASKSDLGKKDVTADLFISSKTGSGIDVLKREISKAAAKAVNKESGLISRIRDKQALESAIRFLAQAGTPGAPEEIAAENLRLCSQSLARMTGEIDAEQILDRLFAGFCIGK